MASQHSSSGPARPRERRHAELEAEHRHARALLQALGQSPCGGHRVRWLDNAAPALVEAVARTRRQLQLDQSLLRDAPAALHQALLAAARRGVHLALRGGASLAPGADALRRAGATLGTPSRWRRWWPWRPGSLPLLLADGRFAFIAPGGTRAPVLVLEGPAVPALQQDFLDDWARRLQPALAPRRFAALQPVAGQQQLVRVPAGHPLGAQALRAALLQSVGVAQSRIRLALGPGEKLGPALMRALCQAAWRGVDVELLLPRPVRALALLQRAGALCRVAPGGAQRTGEPPRHAPGGEAQAGAVALAVVDGLWAALGTPRLTDEAAPVLLDLDAGAEFERQFKRRFDAAARVQP